MTRFLVLASSILLLSACATATGPVASTNNVRTPASLFDAAEIANAMKPGNAIVRGQAFSKTVGGDVKYGAGNEIRVLPNTDFVSECLLIVRAGFTSDCMAKVIPLARTVTADGEGRFEIDGLSPGAYQISTVLIWGVPGPFGIQQTGGVLSKVVTVSSDADVITTNLN